MIKSTGKRLASAPKAVVALVIVVAVVVAIVSASWYFMSPVERTDFTLKLKSLAISGSITGGMFALLAVGFTLSYGVTEVVNMGYGAVYMLGTYFFFAFGPVGWYLHLSMFPALILSIILAGLAGVIIYIIVIRPVVEDPLAAIVSTIAVAVVIQQIMQIWFGPDYRPVRFYRTMQEQPPPLDILGTSVPYVKAWCFAVSIVLFVALWLFVSKTKIGAAMRAIAQDREVAMLMGINTERIYILTMALSSTLAALAGILTFASNWETTYPYIWTRPLVLSFAIIILGGLGSIKGSLLGAFIVGYSDIMVRTFVPQGGIITGAVYLAIMVLVLLIRPKGLFGKRIELE